MAQKRQRKDQDPVIGFISGRMVQRIDSEGKTIQVFQPFKRNPSPTLQELRKAKSSRFTEDEILTHEGLRLFPSQIDFSVFEKSDKEKELLTLRKKEHKSTLVKAGFNPSQRLNISSPMFLGSLRELRTVARV